MKGLIIKNIEIEKYVENELNGKVTYCDKIENAMKFWADKEDSEMDAELTLLLLNETHEECFVLIETP